MHGSRAPKRFGYGTKDEYLLRVRIPRSLAEAVRRLAASGIDPETGKKPTMARMVATLVRAGINCLTYHREAASINPRCKRSQAEAEAMGLSSFRRDRRSPSVQQRVKVWHPRLGRYVTEEADGSLPEVREEI